MKRLILCLTLLVMFLFSSAYAGSLTDRIKKDLKELHPKNVFGEIHIHSSERNKRDYGNNRDYRHRKDRRYYKRNKKRYKNYDYKYDHRYRRYDNRRNYRGYWDIRKVWIPAEYEWVWVREHYNKRGRWVSGSYEEVMINEGYWETTKVWISN